MSRDYQGPGGSPLERFAQQQAGKHPAPCARSCEANAYQIELRRYQAEVEQFRADARRFRLAEKNLFDVQEAAKTIAKQAIAAEAERDAMAAKLKDAEHDRDEFRRVMNGFAEKMAELEGQEPVAWQHRNGTLSCRCPDGQAGAYWVPLYARPSPAEPVEMSPDFTDTARSALLWVLWHHQGGSSPVGQPIRQALGMDAHERLSERQVQEAKKWAAISGAKTNDFHRSEPVNARLLEALIQCRDRFLFYVEHHLANGAAVKAAENDRFVTLANQAIAAAEAQQAGPVRPKVSFIPSVENMPMARSIDDEMMDLVDRLGALEPVDPRAWKHLLVYAPKTDPVRLTRVDIEKAFAQAGLKPEDYREDGEILPLVIAIESATLRKNGIEVAE